jgi:two-component system response regulator WspF
MKMRVAIVNDMRLSVEILRAVVQSDPELEVAWTAADGREAVMRCQADTPDLLIMDLFMPVMDGTEATRRIMASAPCPILIVTASVDTNSSKVFETLGAGALDAVRTPTLGLGGAHDGATPLLRKISQFKTLISIQKPKPKPSIFHTGVAPAKPGLASCELVVIGASTGGPSALAELFSQIPSSINAAFVVVQHVDRQFAQGLASWLDSFGRLKVELARPGESPERGKALVACTNDHLILDATNRFLYVKEPEENPFRPSVDVFFNSVVASCRQRGLAVLLTGIGRDGAVGLFNLRKAGWHTFAQSKESCVVFGMPKAAIELGSACEISTPREIGARIVEIVNFRSGGRVS